MSRWLPFRRQLVLSARATGGVMGFLTLYLLVFLPLHVHGFAQPLLGPLNRVGSMLLLPGAMFAARLDRLGYRAKDFSSISVALLGCLIFYGIVFWAYFARRDRSRQRKAASDAGAAFETSYETGEARSSTSVAESILLATPTPNEAATSRRAFLIRSVPLAGAAMLGTYAMAWEPQAVRITRRRIPVTGLPQSLESLRVVHLSDLHHSSWTSLHYLRGVIRQANALRPDLILITGDYISSDIRYIAPVARLLRRLEARLGVVGTLGNHDHWVDGDQVRAAVSAAGVRMIDNSRVFLRDDRTSPLQSDAPRDGRGLCLAGVGDYWTDAMDFDGALRPAPDDMPRLVLCHNPDGAESEELLTNRPRVDLLLCGHTHGGQVRLPLLGTPVVPSWFGQKYVHGLIEGPACPVLVNSGIGLAVLPVRFGVPPEIGLLDLVRA